LRGKRVKAFLGVKLCSLILWYKLMAIQEAPS
jgi:hypothetical protein